MAKPTSIAACMAAALCCAGQAQAQNCDAQIARVEARYGLGVQAAPAVPPVAPPPSFGSHPLTDAERHAQSGGVLTPPDIGAPVAAAPPLSGSSMPPPGVAPTVAHDAAGLSAAERERMTALMDQARAASRRGDIAGCADRLRAAEAVPGVSGARRTE